MACRNVAGAKNPTAWPVGPSVIVERDRAREHAAPARHRPRASARGEREVAAERIAGDDRTTRGCAFEQRVDQFERRGERKPNVAAIAVTGKIRAPQCDARRQQSREREPRLAIDDRAVKRDHDRTVRVPMAVEIGVRNLHEARPLARRNAGAMAQSERHRLLERALALPQAHASDFFGDRKPPHDADPTLLKRIDDTSLRTKLVETRLAEGLQSPKGPQRIASIVRIYPDFDAPGRTSSGQRNAKKQAPTAQQPRGLPSVGEMEALIRRIREIEGDVAHELSAEADERVAQLKRALANLDGDELEDAYRELGDALERKRALESQVRFETFRRIESDASIPERAYLRLLRR